MNEIQTKFVEALRSGDFHQISGYLHTDEGYCCMGVATEIIEGPDCWTPRGPIFVASGGLTRAQSDKVDAALKLNKRVTDPRNGGMVNLGSAMIDMNDSGSYTFDEIADFYEENA